MATTDPSAEPVDPATPVEAEILVIVAHPELDQSRANRRLLQSARALQRESPPGRLAVRDLYALYPDYLIDIAVEQAALKAARLVVWQQPIRWYSMPPLLKLWLDDVLTFGWAYGPDGNALARQGPLAGREHRRPRGLVPPGQLQPLLLRRLPAALRADRGAVRHALPAAARSPRRAQGERGRARRATPRRTRSVSPTIPPGRRSISSRTASSARCRRAPGRPIASWKPPDGARRLADRQPHLPRRRSDRGAARALPQARLDHRLSRRRHPDRPVGAEARDAARGHAAVRRVRRRPDALSRRPRARAATALVAAQADLRLGQRPAVRLGAAARARRARLRHRLAPRRRRRARPGDVVDGDRPRRARRAQRDGAPRRARRSSASRCCRTSRRSRSLRSCRFSSSHRRRQRRRRLASPRRRPSARSP